MTAPQAGARPRFGATLVLIAAASWGSFGLFGRALYDYGFSALEVTSLRVTVAAGALLLLVPFLPQRRARIDIPGRDVLLLAAYGGIAFNSFALLFFMAVERTTVAIAAALLYTAPAFVVVLARILWREPIDATKVLALAAVLVGVALVTGAAHALFSGGVPITPAAALLGIGSGATYGVYSVLSKVVTHRYSPFAIVLYGFGAAALVLAPFAAPWHAIARAPQALPLVLALGLGPALAAFFLYLRGLREIGAGTASMLACIEPVSAALLAALLIGEPLDLARGGGVLLIVAAAILLAATAERGSSGAEQSEPGNATGPGSA